MSYVSLPSRYIYICVCVYVLRLPIIFFDDYPWKTGDYYVYVYIYGRVWWKKRRLAIEIVDTTKDQILFLEGDKQPTFAYWWKKRKEKWFNLYKYCTCKFNERRRKYIAKFYISLVIMNIYIYTCRAIFLFLLLFFFFFSSSACQLRFGLVSLLLVAIRLHHHHTTTSSYIHICALLPKSIWIRRKFKAYLPKLLTW